MRLDDLAVDHEAIEQGTWRPAVGLPGVEFKLRGAENLAWRRLQSKLMADLPREKQLAASLDPEDDDAIMSKLLARACLLDWRGIDDPISATDIEATLADPKMKRLRSSVLLTARILANETAAERALAAKN